MTTDTTPTITRRGLASMQVCVSAGWTDDQITEFADLANPSGTDSRWKIRRAGDPALAGHPERNQCDKRKGCIHVMLDC